MSESVSSSGRPARRGFTATRLAVSAFAGALIALAIAGRPLTAPLPETVRMADMTWVEVKSAIAQGYDRVLVPSGGIEQNGPHMILGKHDYIVSWAAGRIAVELGRTLVAPVVSFVPEGDFSPPSGHLRFPGTIGVSEPVYAGMLEGIARSLKAGGFKTICFIADHGGSMKAQADVAARLAHEWAHEGVNVISVDDYYVAAGDLQTQLLEAQGETKATIGEHAGIADTSELMAVHPAGVDLSRYSTFGLTATGVSGDPRRASLERGKALIDIKVQAAVRQISAGR